MAAVPSLTKAGVQQLIAKGNNKGEATRRQIAMFEAMIGRWNREADEFRKLSRGTAPVSPGMLVEVDRTRGQVREALELCDRMCGKLGFGDQSLRDLMQAAVAFEALSESLAISAEHLAPRIETSQDVAGLQYLLGELRKDAGLPAR